jgi:hypothetical protein
MLLVLASLAVAAPSTLARCTDTLSALPGGMNEVFRRVVRIETARGTGSGAVVSPDGFILTAAHVVAGEEAPKIFFQDETSLTATVVRRNASADLALLRVAGTALPCVALGEARLAPAADTWIVGSPGGKALTGSVTKGIVSGYRERDGWPILQTDASMSPGNSGGPLLGADGRVQAVVSYKVFGGGAEGLGFAVAAEAVTKALDVSFGGATDATVATTVIGGGTAVTPFTIEPPSFKNQPATPGKPPRGNVCADASVGRDPFSGDTSLTAVGADLFTLTWSTGKDAVLTAYYPMRGGAGDPITLNEVAYGPGGITLDLLLADDTRIHLVSEGASPRMSGLLPVVAARFVINRQVADAVAASGPTYLRWTAAGNDLPIDQDRSDRQRDKYYRPMFACLAQQLAAAPASPAGAPAP